MNTLEFDRLVQKYQSLVYTICHQLVPDEGDAQDLTQETFLAAWRNMSRCPVGYEKPVSYTHLTLPTKRIV